MRRLIETTDGGFDSSIGEKICLFCVNYIYTGRLVAVNDDHVELDAAQLVYETGVLDSGDWEDSQSLPSPWRVMRSAVESWGAAKC